MADFMIYLLALLIFVYWQWQKFSYWRSRDIQGPTPWPILGTNIYYLLRDKLEVEREWHDKFGTTYGLYDGFSPVLRTTDEKLIKFVLEEKPFLFLNRDGTHRSSGLGASGWSIGELLKGLIHKSDVTDRHWLNHFSILEDKSVRDEILSWFPEIYSCLNDFLTRAPNLLPRKKSFTMDMRGLCYLALDSISGEKMNDWRTDTMEQSLRSERFISESEFIRYLVWAFVPSRLACCFNFEILSAHDPKLCSLRKVHESNKWIDDSEFRNQMTSMFLAGFKTTGDLIRSCFHVLAYDQVLQDELLTSMCSDFGSIEQARKVMGNPSLFYECLLKGTCEDTLNQLDAFVSETLRLFAKIEMKRVVSNQSGVSIPGRVLNRSVPVELEQGTRIEVDTYQIHHDRDRFEDPYEHDPWRFCAGTFYDPTKGLDFIPFGFGSHSCVGKRLALLSVKLVVARTVLNYRISPGPKSEPIPPSLFGRHRLFYRLSTAIDFDFSPR